MIIPCKQTILMSMTDPEPKTPWYHFTFGRVFLLLLLAETPVLVLGPCRWCGWRNAILIGLTVLLVTPVVALIWFLLEVGIRRRFQFSIRSLLLLMLLTSLVLSWVAVKRQETKRQQAVAEVISKLGGTVLWDVWDGSESHPTRIFSEVNCVDFRSGTHVADAALERLKEFPALTELGFTGSDISDAQLEYLEKLPRLREVIITSTKVTPAGVERLQQALPHCRIIY